MVISFTVDAVPVAQPRQRHSIKELKSGKSFVHNYTPKSDPVNDFKASVRIAARQTYKGPPLDEPLYIGIIYYFSRPKTKMWKKKEMPAYWKTTKPDLDNLQKAVYDALKGIIWRDDALICANRNRKLICSGTNSPHVSITIKTIDKE